MSNALAVRRARSRKNWFPIKVGQYLPVNLAFQSPVDSYADDINHSDFLADSEVINMPFHAFIASSMPSHSLFKRDRTLSQRGSSIEIVPLLYLDHT